MQKIFKNKTLLVLSLALGTIITIILYNYMLYNSNKNDLKYIESSKKVCKSVSENNLLNAQRTNKGSEKIKNSDKFFYIYICGSVKKPGAYKVKSGDIIWNVINKNGGFSKNADLNKLNMAKEVSKGEMVYVPKIGEEKKVSYIGVRTSAATAEEVSVNNGKININTASEEQLDSLPKIGAVRAKSIIEYRKIHGKFNSINDLESVDGIGKKTFDALKNKICVN